MLLCIICLISEKHQTTSSNSVFASETHRLHAAQEVTHGRVYIVYLSQSQNNFNAFAEVHAAIAKDQKEVLVFVSSIQGLNSNCSDIRSD